MSEKKKEGLNIEIGEEVSEGVYSNLAIINHSPSEFIADFILLYVMTKKLKFIDV